MSLPASQISYRAVQALSRSWFVRHSNSRIAQLAQDLQIFVRLAKKIVEGTRQKSYFLFGAATGHWVSRKWVAPLQWSYQVYVSPWMAYFYNSSIYWRQCTWQRMWPNFRSFPAHDQRKQRFGQVGKCVSAGGQETNGNSMTRGSLFMPINRLKSEGPAAVCREV